MISIRKVQENELEELIQLAQSSFVDTYAIYNTEEDMEKYLRENFTVDIFKENIRNGKIFFVVVSENEIQGYVQLSDDKAPESLDFDTSTSLSNRKLNQRVIEIERLYVAKKHHGKKIGSKLIDITIQFANENQYSILWLGVWKNNINAIEFYKKLGFEIFGEHHFILGNDVQDDWLMKKELR